MLFALAWRNIWRHPHRTILCVSSITIAAAITVFLLSFERGAYGTMKENVLRLMDGFSQVQASTFQSDPDLRKTIDNAEPLMRKLASIQGITAVAPRTVSYVILNSKNRSYAAALVGIDPAREVQVSTLYSTVVAGRFLKAGDGAQIVIGDALARNLHVGVGGTLTLLGTAADGTVAADVVTVAGIFRTGTPDLDRQTAEMPLSRFQNDFAIASKVNLIVIAGHSLGAIQNSLQSIQATAKAFGADALDWTRLEPAVNDIILFGESFWLLIYISLIAIVVFILLNTILMSLLERHREFGMLMAIGMRPTKLGLLVWVELFFLAVLGTSLGTAIGFAATAWAAAHGIPFPDAGALFARWHMPATLYPQIDAVGTFAGPIAIALSITCAGVIPFSRVMRLSPIAAMSDQ